MRDFESLSLHHSTREGFLNKIATYRHLIDVSLKEVRHTLALVRATAPEKECVRYCRRLAYIAGASPKSDPKHSIVSTRTDPTMTYRPPDQELRSSPWR